MYLAKLPFRNNGGIADLSDPHCVLINPRQIPADLHTWRPLTTLRKGWEMDMGIDERVMSAARIGLHVLEDFFFKGYPCVDMLMCSKAGW